jgi:hypothetical protein
MKTILKITGLLAALFLLQAVVFAADKPTDEKISNNAAVIVERLNRDVALTDSQQVVLLEHAKVLTVAMQSTADKFTNDAIRLQRRTYVQQYKAALNSILTDEQKEMLERKREEKREAIVKKYASIEK